MENPDVHEEQPSFEALESMMGSLADGFVLTDADSRGVYMNKAAEDIFQFRFQLGKNMYFRQIANCWTGTASCKSLWTCRRMMI